MSSKIYTKTGDKGTTSLIGGTKISKAHLRIASYGNIDELNSYIGLCKEHITDKYIHDQLYHIQDRLFTMGAALAVDPHKDTKMALPDLHDADCIHLEKEIDAMMEIITPMKFFILPGGSVAIAHLHVARCICRRAERSVVRLKEQELVENILIIYLNRLSDYLFTLARYMAHIEGIIEIPWRPRK